MSYTEKDLNLGLAGFELTNLLQESKQYRGQNTRNIQEKIISFKVSHDENEAYYVCVCMLSRFIRVQFCAIYGLQPARLLCLWDSPDRNAGVGPVPSPGDLPDPGIKSTSFTANLHWTASSLPLAPPGKPKVYHTIQ